jgi:hypothetical protein
MRRTTQLGDHGGQLGAAIGRARTAVCCYLNQLGRRIGLGA